jgi:hypothetical protein
MRLTSQEITRGEKLWQQLCTTFNWNSNGDKVPVSRRFTHPRMPWSEGRGGFMDVVYEIVHGGSTDTGLVYSDIAFGHVYTQEGDLMYSPEIVVRVIRDGLIVAIPIEVTDHRMGVYRRAIDDESGQIVSASMVKQIFGLAETVLANIQAYDYGIKESQ